MPCGGTWRGKSRESCPTRSEGSRKVYTENSPPAPGAAVPGPSVDGTGSRLGFFIHRSAGHRSGACTQSEDRVVGQVTALRTPPEGGCLGSICVDGEGRVWDWVSASWPSKAGNFDSTQYTWKAAFLDPQTRRETHSKFPLAGGLGGPEPVPQSGSAYHRKDLP